MRLRGTMRVNEGGRLEIGGCDAVELAERFGTPLYVLDEEAFTQRVRELVAAFREAYPGDAEVVYAGKAFLTVGFARLVEAEGLSLDVASGGELYTAQVAGFPPERLVVHGNNKAVEELEMALQMGAGRLVVDNLAELDRLIALARGESVATRLLLRTRPGILVETHEHVRTGQEDSKFGLSPEELLQAVERLRSVPELELAGLHAHLGSQISDPDPYERLGERMVDWLAMCSDAYGRVLGDLNLGGGWAVPYVDEDPTPPAALWARALARGVTETARRRKIGLPRLLVEPGRLAVAEAGSTLYRVGAVKEIPGVRTYIVTDGGLYESLRAALYRARYEMIVANRAAAVPQSGAPIRVVGKNCESGDVITYGVSFPPVEVGDVLAVTMTGAYHFAMASNYNRLPRPAVVVVRGGRADLLVERESYDDLVRRDRIPARWEGPFGPPPRESVNPTP